MELKSLIIPNQRKISTNTNIGRIDYNSRSGAYRGD